MLYPPLALLTLDQKQQQNTEEKLLEKGFYIDNSVKLFATPEQAISVIRNSQAMCAATQLHLHKFASNDKRVLEALSVNYLAKSLKDLGLCHNTLPLQRLLGTYW